MGVIAPEICPDYFRLLFGNGLARNTTSEARNISDANLKVFDKAKGFL